jgi:hypothetical protein
MTVFGPAGMWCVHINWPTAFHSRLGLNMTVSKLKWIVSLNIIWHLFVWQVSTLVAEESSWVGCSELLVCIHQTTLCYFPEVHNVKMNCTSWSVLCQNIYQPEKVECCNFFGKHVATNISLFIKALKACVSLRVCAHVQMWLIVTFSHTRLVHLLHKRLF